MSATITLSPEQAQGGVTLSQIWSIVRAWRRTLALIAIVVLLGSALELVPPLLIRQIVDQHVAIGQREGLLLLALLYLGSTAAVQVLGFLSEFLMAITAQSALHRLRGSLFSHLQTLPLSYYDRTPLGETIGRCTADIETVATLFSQTATAGAGGGGGGAAGGAPGAGVLTGVVRLFTIGAAMFVLSPTLAIVSALVVPPLVVVTRAFQIRVRDAQRANRAAVGLQNTHLQETLSGVEVIRALGRETTFIARFRLSLQQGLVAFNRSSFYTALYTPLTAIMAALATALILWVGAGGVLASWGVSLGTLTAFVLLFQRFFEPITTLGNQWQTVQAALAGLERIFQVLDLPAQESTSASSQAGPNTTGGAIELRNVLFGYLPDHPVLNDVSLIVQPGEHVALVGRTGAGKTSTLHLLGGLYAPWSGTVRISGINPCNLKNEEQRSLIGFVPQVVQLFSGTVLENLTLGDTSVSKDDVRKAAAIAGADSFIMDLPQGYETQLRSRVQLSAGQRQLLTLARALVWDPEVLLLDEATAAVDSASEAAFRGALRNAVVGRGRAVLSVAHRLSTAREASRVVVMEEGRVVEQGSPDELILRDGWFAAMLEMEEAGWEWQADGGYAG
jgi:ATP-binding cassette subfamily B protein